MFFKKEFEEIEKDLNEIESRREKATKIGKEIVKLSKIIINFLHRNKIKEAKKYITKIKKKIKKLKDENLDKESKIAFQEYAEAMFFYEFKLNNKIPTRKEIEVGTEEYLLGLCDFIGELVREAVNCAINNRYEDVVKIKNFVEDLYGEFLKFCFTTGELRKKFDSIKWNLNKLNDLVLQMKFKMR